MLLEIYYDRGSNDCLDWFWHPKSMTVSVKYDTCGVEDIVEYSYNDLNNVVSCP
jgi:hypothetical protein